MLLESNKNIVKYQRYLFLDFLRFIAVSAVILHHCFAIMKVNYGTFSNNVVYKLLEEHGAWGVKLFFAISGCIMFSKYQKNIKFIEFMLLRITRLWPMLYISVCISICLLKLIEFKEFSLVDIIPSLLMLDPEIFNKIFFKYDFHWIDNSYWSLFVEMRYYFIYAIILQITKKLYLDNFRILLYVFFASQITYILSIVFNFDLLRSLIFWCLIPDYFGFFLVGILSSAFLRNNILQKRKLETLVLLMGIVFMFELKSIIQNSQYEIGTNLVEIGLIFALFILSELFMNKFNISHFLATYIGQPSYISYLLHQNLFLFTLSLINIPGHLYIILILYIIFLILISYWMSKYLEPILILTFRNILKL